MSKSFCVLFAIVAVAFVGCARMEKEASIYALKSTDDSKVERAPAPVSPPSVAPTAAATWSYRMVNATGLPGAVTFVVQGRTLQVGGYLSGEVTGTLLPPGEEFVIAAHHSACTGPQQTVIRMQTTQQLAVVAYRQDPARAGDQTTIHFSVIEARPLTNSRRGLVVSYCQPAEGATGDEMVAHLGDTRVPLVYAQPQEVVLQLSKQGQGTALPVKLAEATVDSLDLERWGNTAVVFYTDMVSDDVRSVHWSNDRQE